MSPSSSSVAPAATAATGRSRAPPRLERRGGDGSATAVRASEVGRSLRLLGARGVGVAAARAPERVAQARGARLVRRLGGTRLAERLVADRGARGRAAKARLRVLHH